MMNSILNSLKLASYSILLIVLISPDGFASQYSLIKKNENLYGKEKFQKKKNPSTDRFIQHENKSNSHHFDQKFSKKKIRLETWDKHFSTIGQKKIFSDKSTSSSDKMLKKKIQQKKNIEIEESNWSQHLAKIHKDAGINLSQQSRILDNKESYNLVLQNMGHFEEMAEMMDLKSINRYQFRSNRPEGRIPVDKVNKDAVSPN